MTSDHTAALIPRGRLTETGRLPQAATIRSSDKSKSRILIPILILCLVPIIGHYQSPIVLTDGHLGAGITSSGGSQRAAQSFTLSQPGSQAFPVSFTTSPTTPAVGYPVTFNATASLGTAPYTFFWKFSDGSNATGNPISHTYLLSSSFNVQLNVSDATGAFSTAYTSIKVQYDVTVASFAWTPAAVFAGETVFFDASSSTDSIGQIVSYSWSFGDGTSGKGIGVLHTYSSPGVFQVGFNLTDSSGATLSKSLAIWVHPALSITASSNATQGLAPLFVSFNSSVSGGQSPYTYSWDFGDGLLSARQSPIHNFTIARLYRVQLTVTDTLGHAITRFLNITVNVVPIQPTMLGVSEATLKLGGILTAISILPLTIFAVVRRRK